MLSAKTIVTLLTISIISFGCGLDQEGAPQREELDPGSSTIFVGETDEDKPEVDEEQPGGSIQLWQRHRVAMLVDTSQSMIITDPAGPNGEPTARERAAREVMDHLMYADAAYALIPFSGEYPVVNAGINDGFTNDPEAFEAGIPALGQGKSVTDFQPALMVTRDLIAADIAASTEEELARTTYTVIFVADGPPGLICAPGCNGRVICDEPREQWCGDPQGACESDDCGAPGCNWWPLLEQCGAYNTPQVLQELSAEISSLSSTAKMQFHTVLMTTSQTPAWVNEGNRGLLSGMAAAGGGVYLEVSDMSKLSFVNPLGL